MNFRSFASDSRPIGVFDSGVGGLTVLKALQKALPGQDFIYLGDTARVPYGTKSAETVKTYALSLTRFLLQQNVRMVVIACNTASAHATEAVAALAGDIPVIGMIAPGVEAALNATRNGHVLVMATQSTVHGGAYETALKARRPDLRVTNVPAQLLVALAEEGWTEGAVAEETLRRYIGPMFSGADRPDTIILGCTHFPLLRDMIAKTVGPDVRLVDTGEAAASFVQTSYGSAGSGTGTARFYLTDSVERFAAVAERFLGAAIDPGLMEQVDLQPFPTANGRE